ncbi:MAG: phage terminase large subunit [Pseudobdellovibrionaceae bacterium]
MTTRPVSFILFLSLWNRMQGLGTPDVHYSIADFLESAWEEGETKLCLMAFRACGKSTLVGLFCAWLLYQKPELRILVLAAEGGLAAKMVANIRRIIEKHPLAAHLRPRVPEQWAADRFTVKREMELRDPSVLARGITANVTGTRADFIICDDVEVPNTADTADKRADLRTRLSEADFILTQGGTQLYVGTPHTSETIYNEGAGGFLNGFKICREPLLNRQKLSAWPEKFTDKAIADMRRKVGPNIFKSQMLLEPVDIAEARLDPQRLVVYREGLDVRIVGGAPVIQIGQREIVSASCWWDPAFGSANGDGSVVAIIFSDKDGNYYLQNVTYIKIKVSHQEDEASLQCRAVCNLVETYFVPSVAIEINGIGKFLPAILRRELAHAGLSCAVVEVASTRPKELRILEGFDAVLAARALHVHEDVMRTPFVTEMKEWRPGLKTARDDGLDAVAAALSREPVRIRSVTKKASTAPNNPFRARTYQARLSDTET